jgi:hypothetical protein
MYVCTSIYVIIVVVLMSTLKLCGEQNIFWIVLGSG